MFFSLFPKAQKKDQNEPILFLNYKFKIELLKNFSYSELLF